MWAPGLGAGVALLALLAWSFHERYQLLAASPFPLGVDGYFYPIELRALLDHGRLAYPASPLAFYLLAPFAAATDPITGAKLGAAVLGAAIALPAYGVGARLGGGRPAGLLAAVLATTSVGSVYLTTEFVKNSIGLTVALAAVWAVLAAADRPTLLRLAAALAGMIAAWATHKMAAALVIAVAAPVAIAAATTHGRLRGRRLFYAIGAALLAAIAAIAAAAAFPHRFPSPGDAALARDLVSATPQWTAPALVLPSGARDFGHDALLGLVLAVAALADRLVRGRSPADPQRTPRTPPPALAAARGSILVLALAIGLPFLAVTDRDGLGFRLRLAAFVPAALTAAIAVRAALERVPRDRFPRTRLALAALTVAIAAVLAVVRRPGAIDGVITTHPALVSAALALRGRVPPGATLIVPERHIAFMVAWYTGAPVAIRPDGVPPAGRYRLLPLYFIGADSALDRQLIAARAEPSLVPPLGVHPNHPDGLVLVAEPTWAWVLGRLPAADRAYFAAWPTI
jgi:hypothetical protein